MGIKLFADGADLNGIIEASKNPEITGFTTNPTLMKQAGVTDYEKFAHQALMYLANTKPDTCLSLEVFADTADEMIKQARIIDSWGDKYAYDVYVKIPVTNTRGEFMGKVITTLMSEKIKLNVTAVLTVDQVENILIARSQATSKPPLIISIFAGRIADTGLDPAYVVKKSITLYQTYYQSHKLNVHDVEFLWASPREAYNYRDAEASGCDIITMTPALITKVMNFGKSLSSVSLDTVKMFYNDAIASGFTIGE